MATISKIKLPNIENPYDLKDTVSGYATEGYVDTAIENLPKPMIFKGTVGDGGTITWAQLPVASTATGHTYKVITAHSTEPICKVGDQIISNTSSWVVIPSGDEPSGTVTSVGLESSDTGTYGVEVGGTSSPITSSGTFTVGLNAATEAKIAEIDNKAEASSPALSGSFSLNRAEGSTVGTDSVAMGYNSVAMGSYSFASGKESVAGSKAFGLTQVDATNHTVTLDSTTGIETTDKLSFYICEPGLEPYDYNYDYNTIVSINNNVITLTNNSPVFNWGTRTIDTQVSYCWVIGNPNLGTTFTIGTDARAEGNNAIAQQESSLAEGKYTVASGKGSHAEGRDTTAASYCSHAEGRYTLTSGMYSHAEGHRSVASGDYAHAEGYSESTSTTQDISLQLPNLIWYGIWEEETQSYIVSASDTFSLAYPPTSEYGYSVRFGSVILNRYTDGTYYMSPELITQTMPSETVQGDQLFYNATVTNITPSTASGKGSHAEGHGTTASGTDSHAQGWLTQATNACATAEGYKSIASGSTSHAEGAKTLASGDYSHSEGINTIAAGSCQHAFGQYNVSDTTSARITGWGSSSARKNIEKLTSGGTLRLKGDVYTGCTDTSTGGNKLASESYVTTAIASKADNSAVVHNTGNEDIDGNKNFNDDVNIMNNISFNDGGNIYGSEGAIYINTDLYVNSDSKVATESYVTTAVSGKQDTLVSGTNIKTINSQSILGSGDITIGGGSITHDDTLREVTGGKLSVCGLLTNNSRISEGKNGELLIYSLYEHSPISVGKPNSTAGIIIINSEGPGGSVIINGYDNESKITLQESGIDVTTTEERTFNLNNSPIIAANTIGNYALAKTNPVGSGSFSFNRKASTTVGQNSFTLGYNNEASSSFGIAMGYQNKVSNNGTASFVGGQGGEVTGGYSFAYGMNLKIPHYSSADGCAAFGRNNVSTQNARLVIGNGTGTADEKRSNAFAVMYNGNAYLKGDLYVGCNADSTGGNIVETTNNKVTSISSSSTDTQYPSAKCVWDGTQAAIQYIMGTVEQLQVTATDWLELTSADLPFTQYSYVVPQSQIGATTIIELLNDQPVAFANCGFAILEYSTTNGIKIGCINPPSDDITFSINIRG